ncbi:hypothetical protein FRX31_023283 [Thalictrum thalictroides]|uniref:Uncharacterized protein n=1 Tax=Thalictrum thalictroides TaxID=46969 RepID=A0A7J6VSF2_THATH|nr:hypothetical protein FRX31_023283 [Thalictrum thalictroides]
MNVALLAKWLWRFGCEPDALWRRVIFTKYGNGVNDWWPKPVQQSHGCSLWKGVMNMYDVFKQGISCRVGNGRRILFWHDEWLGNTNLMVRFPLLFTLSNARNSSVYEMKLGGDDGASWDLQMRRSLRE